jgi:DNA-binding transcriptional MerR regulator
MENWNSPGFLLAADDRADGASRQAKNEPVYTIGELAKKFKVSHRTLRFYESVGLLTPLREGHRRIYGRKDADRLAVIVKAKKFGFTLSEARQMIADGASQQTLKLSREKCLEQIAVLERKLVEIERALAELRRITALLSGSFSSE